MNFWPIFILFFYFFLFVFLKNFFIFEKFEKAVIADSEGIVIYTYSKMPTDLSYLISNGGPGGRLAPPAFKCHKKNVSRV